MNDVAAAVAAVDAAVDVLDLEVELVGDDLIDLWIWAKHAVDRLAVAVRAIGAEAAVTVADLNAARGRGPREEYVTATGNVVHLAPGSSRTEWQGYAFVNVLADPLVDPETGEVVRAVPVDVLRRVVPGCGAPHLTSSKWNISAIPPGIVAQYRRTEPVPDVIREGERVRR